MRPAFSLADKIADMLAPAGIYPRGIVQFETGEGPELGNGEQARTVILLGNIGGSIWQAFSSWREEALDRGGMDPLDTWSKVIISPIAGELGAAAWFPSDPPYMPFQTWAKQAEGLHVSPLGILIHPDYGLWHGYRGALGFAEAIDAPDASLERSPCGDCVAKPCLSACPASAIHATGFEITACRAHLRSEVGQGGCMQTGCAARNACPVGVKYRYSVQQIAFHMAALKL
jgi:hypothetical protein